VLNPLLVLVFLAWIVFAARVAGGQEPQRQASLTPVRRMPVAVHVIARGAVLTADDFEFRDTTSRSAPDTNQIAAGWVTRRTINAGEILREPAVEPPTIVTANTPVQLEWIDTDVRLTVHGTATRSGSLGDRITVRTELGKRIEGTVVGPGRVRID
jgi:flagella basal body P-ring formation protein FlgA